MPTPQLRPGTPTTATPTPTPQREGNDRPRKRSSWYFAWATLAVVGMILALTFVRLTIDDAFITWRYGQTLVDTGQWNWQPNTPRVEAYTNPAYAFASVIPALLGVPAEFFFKLVSLGILGALFGYLFTRPTPTWQRFLAITLLAANPVFWIHLWSGLETPLLVTALVITYGELNTKGRLGRLGIVAVVLLALSRPEGFGYAVAAVLWAVVLRRGRRQLLQSLLLLTAFLVYWTARAVLFGAMFPNTFYVKTAAQADQGGVLMDTLRSGGIGVAVLATLACLGLAASRCRPRPHESNQGSDAAAPNASGLMRWTPALLALLSSGVAVIVYANSSLTMNFANRFYWQITVPVVLVALTAPVDNRRRVPVSLALGASAAISIVAPAYAAAPYGLVLAALAVGSAVLVWSGTSTTLGATAGSLAAIMACSLITVPGAMTLAAYRLRLDYSHGALGRALSDLDEGERTLAMVDSGKAPMRSGWRSIDLYGLANRQVAIAGRPGPALRSWEPSVVAVISGRPYVAAQRPRPVGQRDVMRYVRTNGQTRLGAFQFRPGYYLVIYTDPDMSPADKQVLRRAMTSSERQNNVPDSEFLRKHVLDFPFLHP